MRVSELGLGSAVYAGTGHGPFDEQEAVAAIRTALDAGVNYIDTSRHYGPSETIIGKALARHQGECLICTKLGPRSGMTATEAVAGVEASLAALRRPYVDVLLAHDIQQVGEGAAAVEAILQPGGMIDGFRQLQREGRVHFIGVSGRLAEVAAAVRTAEFDVVLSFNRFNSLDWSAGDELLPLAAEKGVGVTIGGVFYQGFLSLPLAVVLERAEHRLFWPWDLTPQQRAIVLARLERLNELVEHDLPALRRLAIRFVLAEPRVGVAVIGMKTPAEVEENLWAAAADGLDAETAARVMALA